jgi:hypothetical protein
LQPRWQQATFLPPLSGFVLQTPRAEEMAHLTHGRRAALEGLARILDADAPEELFSGPAPDAAFLYALLAETAGARSSTYYWEICRTARRRGVTPEYVVDRAVVLLATMEERRRADLYRILGVPALASGEVIRQRWLDLAKQHHPDTGGDGALFRQAKEAYEILRDPTRRAEYERFWQRALGPFERVRHEDPPPRAAARGSLRAWPRAVPALSAAPIEAVRASGVGAVQARLATLLAPVGAREIEALRAEVAASIGALEALREELQTLARLKCVLDGRGSAG